MRLLVCFKLIFDNENLNRYPHRVILHIQNGANSARTKNKKLIKKELEKTSTKRARLTVKKFKQFFHFFDLESSYVFHFTADERDLENISFDQEFAA